MVAYLEKSTGSAGFHQIIDFITRSHISYALTKKPEVWTLNFSTREGSLQRHLQLDDQDGISSLPTSEIFAQLGAYGYATNSDTIGVLEAEVCCEMTKKTYSSAYTKLILRVKKLEAQIKVGKVREHSRFVLSDTEVGADDSSKQGRKFSNEGVQDDEGVHEKASTETELFIQEHGKKRGTASEEVPPVSTAEVHISTAGGTVTYSRRSAEKRTRQDKGKGILVEEEPKKKSKKELEQERLSYAEAIRLEEQMNEEQRAQIARDAEIARQWDEEEKKRAMDEAETTKKIDWNDPSVIRYHSLKMKPKSIAQARRNMIKYLKNQGNFKITDFKGIERKVKKQKLPEKERKRQKLEVDTEKDELKRFLDIVPREEAPIEIESLSTKFPSCKWKDSCVDGDLSYTIKFSETMLYGCHRGMENFPSNPKPKQQQMADSSSTIIKSNPVTLKKRRQKKMIKPNGSQLVYEDLEQIHEDGIEEMDLKWQLALLSMRTKRFFQKTSKKTLFNGSDTVGYDKSKGYFHPPNLVLSNSGLEEFQQPEFEGYGPKTSKSVSEDTSNEVRESPDASLVEELVSNDKLEKKTVFPTAAKINFGKSKKLENQKFQQLGSDFVMYNKAFLSVEVLTMCRLTAITVKEKGWPNTAVVNDVRENQVNAVRANQGTFISLNFNEFDRGYVTFGGGAKGGKITGKETLKTGKLNFEDVYFVKELQFNLFSVSQMCHKKNSVLFTDTRCFILSPDFKLANESQATLDESMLWHRRLGHVNFKTINKLVKENLVRGLPTKCFENDQTCVACLKGKQHKASCKSKIQNSITQPLFMLQYALFWSNFCSSLMNKKYCLVVTDDYSRFTWVFFLATKDETSGILKSFITEIENLVDKKVKIIRCDNGTEFKNKVMSEFCEQKGIKREFSVARTPQQNGVAERRNRTLIEAARTMLADSKLPTTFWAEAVNTACYVQNRVLVVKPHNKTPYELFRGRTPALSFMRPFGCHVTILNTLDYLGKFDGKSDEGFFVGYSLNSKAFRVYNIRTRKVEENLHIRFLEDKPIIAGDGPKWLFDIDVLTKSMNYVPVVAGTNSNDFVGTEESIGTGYSSKETRSSQDYVLMPIWKDGSLFDYSLKNASNDEPQPSSDAGKKDDEGVNKESGIDDQERPENSTQDVNTVGPSINTASTNVNTGSLNINTVSPTVTTAPLEATHADFFGDETKVDMSNITTTYPVLSTPNTRIYKDHSLDYVIGDVQSGVLTRRMTKTINEQGFISVTNEGKTYEDLHTCLFACFLSQEEPKKIIQALKYPSWIEAMQEELLQFKLQQVWTLVDLPLGKRAIGTKWVYRNKKDERVARIEAIRLFLAYASFKDFVVYQMDVKSAFLYGKIEEEVYVYQPLGFEDPEFPDRVYKVEKALYGLHQAPRAWYETLSTYLLDNGFQRGQIDKTLFIKRVKSDILLVQVYVDDIIFGYSKKKLCTEFEKLMHKKFQMSYIGELTFFLGLQVTHKDDGIFISQDNTPMETSKPLLKDAEAEDVHVNLYRSIIGSLIYLTSSKPDIIFAVCACARFQVTPNVLHLHAVKRIFRYLKGQPKLGLWYPKDSPFDLEAYSDSDYAGASLDRKSTTGGCQFLGSKLISWQCKKQTIVANSTTEAEYVAAASCCGQTKHIEIRHHFIRDSNEKKFIQMIKMHTDQNVADLLTKAFDVGRFQYLIASIGMLNL
ncbi:ribonuclease H-like domain-containing protein [Tanacetum coccineum]